MPLLDKRSERHKLMDETYNRMWIRKIIIVVLAGFVGIAIILLLKLFIEEIGIAHLISVFLLAEVIFLLIDRLFKRKLNREIEKIYEEEIDRIRHTNP